MSRLLLLIAIAIVVYVLFKSYRKKALREEKDKTITDDMVRCTHCGLHLPKSESVQVDGLFFCSAEHRDAHRR